MKFSDTVISPGGLFRCCVDGGWYREGKPGEDITDDTEVQVGDQARCRWCAELYTLHPAGKSAIRKSASPIWLPSWTPPF